MLTGCRLPGWYYSLSSGYIQYSTWSVQGQICLPRLHDWRYHSTSSHWTKGKGAAIKYENFNGFLSPQTQSWIVCCFSWIFILRNFYCVAVHTCFESPCFILKCRQSIILILDRVVVPFMSMSSQDSIMTVILKKTFHWVVLIECYSEGWPKHWNVELSINKWNLCFFFRLESVVGIWWRRLRYTGIDWQ